VFPDNTLETPSFSASSHVLSCLGNVAIFGRVEDLARKRLKFEFLHTASHNGTCFGQAQTRDSMSLESACGFTDVLFVRQHAESGRFMVIEHVDGSGLEPHTKNRCN
jgi:hypothetical protein